LFAAFSKRMKMCKYKVDHKWNWLPDRHTIGGTDWGMGHGLMPGVKMEGANGEGGEAGSSTNERLGGTSRGREVACKQQPANTHHQRRVLSPGTGSRRANRQLKRTSRGARFVERSTEGSTRRKDGRSYRATAFIRHCHTRIYSVADRLAVFYCIRALFALTCP